MILGVTISLVVGFLTFLVLWTIILTDARSEMTLTVVIVSGVAGLGGAGAVPAWFVSAYSRRMVAGLVVVALLVGIFAGWVGFMAGTPPVRGQLVDLQTGMKIEFESPVNELFTRSGLQGAWVGGAITANIVLGGIYLFTAIRVRDY